MFIHVHPFSIANSPGPPFSPPGPPFPVGASRWRSAPVRESTVTPWISMGRKRISPEGFCARSHPRGNAMISWWNDGEMMVKWWWTDGEMMVKWWWNDDEMMVKGIWSDMTIGFLGSAVIPFFMVVPPVKCWLKETWWVVPFMGYDHMDFISQLLAMESLVFPEFIYKWYN